MTTEQTPIESVTQSEFTLKYFYSKSVGGFLRSDLWTKAKRPADAVELPLETYTALMSGIEAGQVLKCDEHGCPYLEEYSPPQVSVADALQRLDKLITIYGDQQARQAGYANLTTVCSYVSSKNPQYSQDGEKFSAWRDDLWITFESLVNAKVPVEILNGYLQDIKRLVSQLPPSPTSLSTSPSE